MKPRRNALPASRPVAVVAFGGNALIRASEKGTLADQLRNAGRAATVLLKIVRSGYELVLVHGNGPQVGLSLLRVAAAGPAGVPHVPLDVCVAETQGSMGYLLGTALSNRLRKDAVEKPVVTLLTRVEVDQDDPAFSEPTKPVGPFFTKEEADRMAQAGQQVIEDAGRGWRRVVPSPKPIRVVEIDVIRHLVGEGHIVIAGGGGGIPVTRAEDATLTGIEAVVDKDYVAALVAKAVRAQLFVILTEVPQVAVDFGKPTQRGIERMDLIEAIDHYRDGQFPRGSMGPKIEAAIDYLMNGGHEALVTNAQSLGDALQRRAGTFIVRSQGKGFIDLRPRT
jgi:carbamate kinase